MAQTVFPLLEVVIISFVGILKVMIKTYMYIQKFIIIKIALIQNNNMLIINYIINHKIFFRTFKYFY